MLNFWYLLHFLECGHFCINYVLKTEGIRKRVVYSRAMMSLGLVKRVLLEYFREVKCIECGNLNLLRNEKFITLLRYGKRYYHYVVVVSLDKNYVCYYDPMFLGVRRKKVNRFVKSWSGYCCLFKEKSNC